MAKQTVSVTSPKADDVRLPSWAGQYVLWVRWLRDRGLLKMIGETLKVYRPGGYPGLDGFLFLLGMYSWSRSERKGLSMSDFDEACAFCRSALAAVADRKHFVGQSVMSRLLAAVPAGEMLLNFGAKILSCDVSGLASHPAAQVFDALGQACGVYDFDMSSIVLRERGLPHGDDLPEPVRRAVMAQAGHPGRQRGEVQINGGYLQHAASGLWVQMSVASGNGSMSAMLLEVLPYLQGWRQSAGLDLQVPIVRVDGAGGYMPSLNAFSKNAVDFLVRLTCYGLLDRPAISEWLDHASWQLVPDSKSGPTRQVTELGMWPCHEDLSMDGAPEGLTQARVLVTRYRAEKKHGAGLLRNGWQYELFGTSLHAAAWPATDAVALYFGRASLENRFSQLFCELELKKIFSFHLGGQWLSLLVGLMVSNLRTIAGSERVWPLEFAEVPKMPRVPTATVPSDAAMRAQAHADRRSQSDDLPEESAAQSMSITNEPPYVGGSNLDGTAQCAKGADLGQQYPAEQPASSGSHPRQDDTQPLEVKDESLLVGPSTTLTESSLPAPLASDGPSGAAPAPTAPSPARLDQQAWPTLLEPHPGWQWRNGLGMHCPMGKPVKPLKVWVNPAGLVKLAFRTQEADCRGCPLSTSCGGPHPRARHCEQIAVRLAAAIADVPQIEQEVKELQEQFLQGRTKPKPAPAKTAVKPKPPRSVVPQPVNHPWRAPTPVEPGPWEVQPARLVPSTFRKSLQKELSDMLVYVDVHCAASPKRPKAYAADTTAIRQHRRLTWAERLQRNALPAGSTVHTRIEVRDHWIGRVLAGGIGSL